MLYGQEYDFLLDTLLLTTSSLRGMGESLTIVYRIGLKNKARIARILRHGQLSFTGRRKLVEAFLYWRCRFYLVTLELSYLPIAG